MTGGAILPMLAVFLPTQVLFGTATGAFLVRMMATAKWPDWALLLLGIGLAPCLVTLVLYYSLWLFPGLPHGLAVFAVVVFFVLLGVAAGQGWLAWRRLFLRCGNLRYDRSMWLFALCTLGFFVLAVVKLLTAPLTEHDILEYAVQGHVFLRDMAITYQPHHYDAATGFYYVGLHGFTFPLLFTWEGLVWPDAWTLSNPWVRVLTPFYAWLTVALGWGLMRRVGKWFAVWFVLALGGAMGFFFLGTVYHLDAMRIFLFAGSVVLLIQAVRDPRPAIIGLLGVVCAAGAGVHSLSAILACMVCLVLMALMEGSMMRRLGAALCFGLAFLLAGGIHYPVDVFLGTGWIFKDIVWY